MVCFSILWWQFYVSTWSDRFLFKHYICVCLWGCFWMRLAFELVNWVKQRATFHMNGHQPIHGGPESNKKVQESWIKTVLDCVNWDMTFCLPCPDSQDLRFELEFTLGSSALQTLNDITDILKSPTCGGKLWYFLASMIIWTNLL